MSDKAEEQGSGTTPTPSRQREGKNSAPSTPLRVSGKNKGHSAPLRTGGRPPLLDAAGQARFTAALRRGLSLEDAAKTAGFALRTFYYRRERDADFADEWDEAVAVSAWAWRPRPGQKPRLVKARRLRFSAVRREMFLDEFALTCNTTAAAAAAGVHPSAVYRAVVRDPEFARAVAAALERGYAYLEKEAAREREAAAARMSGWMDQIEPVRPETPPDFETIMKLLRRYERPARRGRRGRLGRRALSHREAVEQLEEKLERCFGARGSGSG